MEIISFVIGSGITVLIYCGIAVFSSGGASKKIGLKAKDKSSPKELQNSPSQSKDFLEIENESESYSANNTIFIHFINFIRHSSSDYLKSLAEHLPKDIKDASSSEIREFVEKYNTELIYNPMSDSYYSPFEKHRELTYDDVYYIEVTEPFLIKGTTIEKGSCLIKPKLSYFDFFEIPVVIMHKISEKDKEVIFQITKLLNCSFYEQNATFITDVDFGLYPDEYSRLVSLRENIKEIISDLKKYENNGGTDEEVISTAKKAVINAQEEGKAIISELQDVHEMKMLENVNEEGLALFNKSMKMLS